MIAAGLRRICDNKPLLWAELYARNANFVGPDLMQFIFWSLFLIFAWAWRGPAGAVLVLLLAWGVRRVLRHGWWSLRPGAAMETYLYCQFAALGLLAKSGGRVTEADIAAVEQFMTALGLQGEKRGLAIRAFTNGRRWHGGMRHAALPRNFERWRRLTAGRGSASQAFLNALVQVILRGRLPNTEQWQVLRQTCQWIAASESEIEVALASMHVPQTGSNTPEALYQELGLQPEASEQDIKQAYRRLMRQYHPDKWAAQHLDPVERHSAEEKVRKIRAAYDELKRRRGFR